MAREQLGICAEANLHGTYLLLNALEGQQALLRAKLALLPAMFNRLAQHFSESMFSGVIAIGSNYWDTLYPKLRPHGLAPFPALQMQEHGFIHAPADLFVQIRSDRKDVNFIACQQLLQLLGSQVEILEQIEAFRYLDGRDFTGFIDAPDNPRGVARRKVALLEQIEQPWFNAGSYLHLQRFRFDISRWQTLGLEQQEDIMGCYKVNAKLLPAERLLANSHRLALTGGVTAVAPTVLWQNMPYAQLKRQGLLTLCFSADCTAFSRLLQYRLGLPDCAAGYDLLLDYYQADLGAAFFAPSVSFLEQAAG